MRGSLLIISLVAAAFEIAACGGDDADTTAPATVTQEEAAAQAQEGGSDAAGAGGGGAKPGIEIATADSEFGTILFDGSDRAIYLFDKDESETSECYGACAEAWPPVLTKGDPVGSGAVDEKLLATTERDDGRVQVTYAGHPLYYYVDDPPGEVLCNDVVEFGGRWLVIAPQGDAAT
jgi:predicted lipoprotein with Yx(FWY)xxD motif